jgi:hypothetical protein
MGTPTTDQKKSVRYRGYNDGIEAAKSIFQGDFTLLNKNYYKAISDGHGKESPALKEIYNKAFYQAFRDQSVLEQKMTFFLGFYSVSYTSGSFKIDKNNKSVLLEQHGLIPPSTIININIGFNGYLEQSFRSGRKAMANDSNGNMNQWVFEKNSLSIEETCKFFNFYPKPIDFETVKNMNKSSKSITEPLLKATSIKKGDTAKIKTGFSV